MAEPSVRASDIREKAARGKTLLTQPPFDVEAGLRLTSEAAQAGDGEAAHLLAVLDASGRMGAANWPRALQLLQRAADLGFPLAQAQTALLVGDANTLLALPPQRALHETPRMTVVENFVAPSLCDWLIARARPALKRAKIDDLATGQAVYAGARTNSTADIAFGDSDVIMHLMRARMLKLAALPGLGLEGISILNYQPGEEFRPHYDFLDPAMPGSAEQVARFGQRVATVLVYLNDDYDGGETEFPILKWRFKARTGDALIFWNVDAGGKPDRLTLHAGLSPTRGEKFLLSQWVRGRVQ
jgi:hypothetical protein